MKRTILSLTFHIIITGLFSQTPIPAGTISGTWEYQGSPYLINGDVTVPNGSSLVIKPGVTVEMQGWYKIGIEGKLNATGTKDSLIYFTIADTTGFSLTDTTAGGWHGIRFENINSYDTSILVNCKLEYGKSIDSSSFFKDACVLYSDNLFYLIMENCIISNNFSLKGSALFLDHTTSSITGSKFYNNNVKPTVFTKLLICRILSLVFI